MYLSKKQIAKKTVKVSVFGCLRGKYVKGSGRTHCFTVRDSTPEKVARIVERALERATRRKKS